MGSLLNLAPRIRGLPRPLENGEKALPARPQRAKARGVRFLYVEGLSEARTQLEGFYNILR